MSHGFSVCKPTGIPYVKTCTNFPLNSGNVATSSINASLDSFNYKFDGDTHQIAYCVPINIRSIPIGNICGGVRYDGSDIKPFISFGAKIGNTGYQYRSNIDELYNMIMHENKCINTTLDNGRTFVTSCNDGTKTTMTLSPDSNTASLHKINSDPNNASLHKINSETMTAKDLTQYLERYDNVITNLQDKTEKIMMARGLTTEQIGITMDRTPLRGNPIEKSPSVSIVDIDTHNLFVSVNQIITNIKTTIPNFTIFNILDSFQQNNIDRKKLFDIISDQSTNNNLKWRIDKTKGQMGSFYPDCCESANQCGWLIDYHLVHKIDYCRICMTPFRLEYFL